MPAQRTWHKWLLMVGVMLGGLAVLAAALRERPDIQAPDDFRTHYAQPEFAATLNLLNEQSAFEIKKLSLETALPADWLTICRRISLGLVGNGLSLEEIRALESVPESDRVQWWTSYLLQDRRWADYFGERLSRAFVGTNEGPFLLFRRRKFNSWLSDQLLAGTRYDAIVRSMLSAEGLWTDTPAVNFVTSTMDESDLGRADPVRLAGRTSRAFLAMRIDCLQCHNDFLGTQNFGTLSEPIAGTQRHFHGLAAFFSGTAVMDPAFRGIHEDLRPYRVELLGDNQETEVTPKVPFYSNLLSQEGKPRQQLAHWVTHPQNKAFARATVNRVWALVVGRPLVQPVDSIPLEGAVPKMLDTLADDFVSHRYDLRRLIRLIIQCDCFRRSSRADFEISEAHEAAWAAFPLIQLRPEQVARCITQACKLNRLDATSSIVTQLQAFFDGQNFLKQFGDRGEDEFDSDSVTVTQRLILMNGGMVAERTKVDLIANASTRIANLVSNNRRAIELLYLAGLNRYPTEGERRRLEKHLEMHSQQPRGDLRNSEPLALASGASNDVNTDSTPEASANGSQGTPYSSGQPRAQIFGDIYWALLNSTEFSWNH